jgi:hypothetical protein
LSRIIGWVDEPPTVAATGGIELHPGLESEAAMLRNRGLRRVVGASLLLAGALMMLFSPSVEVGLVAFALGVVLELAGLTLERRDRP